MTRRTLPRSAGAGLLVALALSGCASAPAAVVPLPQSSATPDNLAGRPLYLIKNGIRVSNTSAVLPTAWKRATGFCEEFGKQPREEQITQQWPAVRDFVFSCMPIADPHFR